MREFEDKYRIDRTSQILPSENAFRQDIDLRLHQLETASATLAQAANDARDMIVRSADLEIAPRVAQMVSILDQFNSNANALRDAVLTIVRDGVEGRGDTLKKLLSQVDAATALATNTANAFSVQFISLSSQLDNKSNVGHGHDLGNISGASQALDGKLSKGSNLSDLENVATARSSLGLGSAATWNVGISPNQVAYINNDGTCLLQVPNNANSWTWGFVSQNLGSNNYAGFIHGNDQNSYMQLTKTNGDLGTRWSAIGDQTNFVNGFLAFVVRAWVNFNGIGTPTIRGSGNISSITRMGTGDYILNFLNPMPDANYSVFANGQTHTSGGHQASDNVFMSIYNGTSMTQNSVRINSNFGNANSGVDMATVCVHIVR